MSRLQHKREVKMSEIVDNLTKLITAVALLIGAIAALRQSGKRKKK